MAARGTKVSSPGQQCAEGPVLGTPSWQWRQQREAAPLEQAPSLAGRRGTAPSGRPGRGATGVDGAASPALARPGPDVQFKPVRDEERDEAHAVQGKGPLQQDPQRIHQLAQEGFQGMPRALPHLDRLQALFAPHDLSGVQAYVGGPAQRAADAMGAEAYTAGERIAFAREPDPATVAHEATHVVQQREGVQLRHGVGEPGDAYEREAERYASSVAAASRVQAKPVECTNVEQSNRSASDVKRQDSRPAGAIQCKTPPGDGIKVKVKGKVEYEEENDKTTVEHDKEKMEDSGVDEKEVRRKVKLEIEQQEKRDDGCENDEECARLVLKIARENNCSPKLVRKIWLETEDGKRETRRRKLKREKQKTRLEKEKSKKRVTAETTIEADKRDTKEDPRKECRSGEELKSWATLEADRIADAVANNLLQMLAVDYLASDTAYKLIKNFEQYASEKDTTPDFQNALFKAFVGDPRDTIVKVAKYLSPAPGKSSSIADVLLKFAKTLEDEYKRALAAKENVKDRDFLNNYVERAFMSLASKAQLLLGTEGRTNDREETPNNKVVSLRAAIRSEVKDDLIYLGEQCPEVTPTQIANTSIRIKSHYQNLLAKALQITPLDPKQYLKQFRFLLGGLCSEGMISFGSFEFKASRQLGDWLKVRIGFTGGGLMPLPMPELTVTSKDGTAIMVEQTAMPDGPPVLVGTRNADKRVDAINKYLQDSRTNVRQLPIEKHLRMSVYFVGDWGSVHIMPGHATIWRDTIKWVDEAQFRHSPPISGKGHERDLAIEAWMEALRMVKRNIAQRLNSVAS